MWSILDNHRFDETVNRWVLSQLRPLDNIRVRSITTNGWEYGQVTSRDEISGLIGVKWFDCAGPMGTVADCFTSETMESLHSMNVELVSDRTTHLGAPR